MSTLAMMVSRDSLDAPLARTFGKAKWLLLWDGGKGAVSRHNEAPVVQLRRRGPRD